MYDEMNTQKATFCSANLYVQLEPDVKYLMCIWNFFTLIWSYWSHGFLLKLLCFSRKEFAEQW